VLPAAATQSKSFVANTTTTAALPMALLLTPLALKGIEMNNEIKMYGCMIDDFIDSVEDSITYKTAGPMMVVAGLMSDAQEMMAFGDVESARQYLNKAKALIFREMRG
jgi:hypothetical protein